LPEAAGPATTITFGIGQLTGTVSCFRAAAGTEGGGSFYVQLIDPVGEAADLAVGVALIEPDGGRQQRTIELEPTSPGQPMLGPVADSADPGRFVDCTVIAVQRDQQVILTGN
jgi:hypothetical protein